MEPGEITPVRQRPVECQTSEAELPAPPANLEAQLAAVTAERDELRRRVAELERRCEEAKLQSAAVDRFVRRMNQILPKR